jgi:DNA-binding CsgD family transcriptional regulator
VIVGRTHELEAAEQALASVSRGAGQILWLTGEAGVGKSHLLGEIARRARERGFEVALGRCFADAAQSPFGPFREALGAQVFDAAPGGRPRSGREGRARSFERVLRVLGARAAAAPLLLSLEDLHWADRESLSLFQHVGRFGTDQSLLLLGTVRMPDVDAQRQLALDELLAELVREPRCQRLTLQPFAPDESAQLCHELAGAPMPQALATALHAETGGNALYLRELVRYLLDASKLALRGGRVATDLALSELGLPPSIRDVVRQRVLRLPSAVGSLLQCAAIAGTPLAAEPLFAMAQLTAPNALEALDAALACGLLRDVADGYELVHAVVRRAIYEELKPSRRVSLHRALAQALTRAAPEQHAQIAAHYHASRALPGAEAGVTHALAAADLARAAGAHERGAELLALARALAVPQADAVLADVERRLAITLAEALDVERALAATEEACRLLARAGQDAAVPELLSAVAAALEAGGVPIDSWESLVARALSLVGTRRDLTWARLALLARRPIRVLEGPVWVSRFAGFDPQAVALLREHGSEHDFAATIEAHDLRAPEQSAALLAQSRGLGDAARARILDACVRDAFFQGRDFPGAVALARELAMLSERSASLAGEASARVLLCCCLAALGEFSAAREALARARELSLRLGAMHRMNAVGPIAAEASLGYFVGASWEALAARFLEFASAPRAAETPFGLVPLSLGTLASSQAGQADAVARLIPLQLRALALLPQAMNEWGAGRDCGASALFKLGQVQHAKRYLELAERSDPHTGCACWSTASHSAARMSSLLGQLSDARAQFERARRDFERSGRAPSLAICDYDEALALTRACEAPNEARALAEAALRKFLELGMRPWAEAAQALLEPSAAAPIEPPDGLTQRELEVLQLLASGLANKQLAAKLFVSVPTIERHISNLYAKIGARGRADATRYALRKGLLPGPD